MSKSWEEVNAKIASGEAVCAAVCRRDALTLAEGTAELVFDKDKCVYCEACVVACTRRAVTLRF